MMRGAYPSSLISVAQQTTNHKSKTQQLVITKRPITMKQPTTANQPITTHQPTNHTHQLSNQPFDQPTDRSTATNHNQPKPNVINHDPPTLIDTLSKKKKQAVRTSSCRRRRRGRRLRPLLLFHLRPDPGAGTFESRRQRGQSGDPSVGEVAVESPLQSPPRRLGQGQGGRSRRRSGGRFGGW